MSQQLAHLLELDRLTNKLRMLEIRFRRAEGNAAEVRVIIDLLETLELLGTEYHAYGTAADEPLKGVEE